jgi:hypothetical protein
MLPTGSREAEWCGEVTGRISVVPGFNNEAAVAMVRATPRWPHQAIFARIMNG